MTWSFPVSFLAGFTVIWLLRFARKRLPMVFQFATLDRQKFLLGLAVCLFVAAMASKAMGAFSVTSGQNPGSTIPFVVLSVIMIAVQIGIVVVVPSWIMLVNQNWKWQLAFLLIGSLAIGVAIWQLAIVMTSSRRPQDCYPILYGVVSAVWMVWIYVAIGTDSSPAEASNNDDRGKNRIQNWQGVPSIWGSIILLTTCAFVSLPGFLETTILLANPLEPSSWALSRQANLIMKPSGSRMIRPTFGRSGGFNFWMLSGSNDEDVFQSFDELNDGRYAVISNLQPHVDTAPLAGVPKSINLVDCRISYSQLSDIVDGANGYMYFQNVELVGDPAKIEATSLAGLSIHSEKPGNAGKILEAMSESEFQYLQLMTRVAQQDILGLQHIAEDSKIMMLRGGIDWNITVPKNEFSLKRVSTYEQLRTVEQLMELIRSPLFSSSDIRVTSYNLKIEQELYWDLHFLFDGRISIPSNEIGEAVDECEDFVAASKKYHWGFGYHPSGELKDLYLPGGDTYFEVGKETQIQTLSFDSGWASGFGRGQGYGSTDLSHLSTLINLKRLYLSDYIMPKSVRFLSNLSKLKHLQIRSPVLPLQDNSGFYVCKSLESLTLFGKPDPLSVQELAGLPKLKMLTIVDLQNEELDDPGFLAAVKKVLPNVELKILNYEQHLKQVPESFRSHQDRLKQELMQKLKVAAE